MNWDNEKTNYEKQKEREALKTLRSECSDLLYGVVEWLDGTPILDGLPYFGNAEAATDYAMKHQNIGDKTSFNVEYTIIRMHRAR